MLTQNISDMVLIITNFQLCPPVEDHLDSFWNYGCLRYLYNIQNLPRDHFDKKFVLIVLWHRKYFLCKGDLIERREEDTNCAETLQPTQKMTASLKCDCFDQLK